MNILVAIDSFKGSINSFDAGNAVKKGILKAASKANVIVKPLADGGEGTLVAFLDGFNSELITTNVINPIGKVITAEYAITKDSIAVIETAKIIGLPLVEIDKRKPQILTTFGIGQVIIDALNRGIKRFIICLGGSATNDGGVGMLQALGFGFYDQNFKSISYGANGLININSIDDVMVDKRIKDCIFNIACDVENPLCGLDGSVFVYGKQKGFKDDEKIKYDKHMEHYANKTQEFIGKDNRYISGVGAAGGLGFAFYSFLNGNIQKGADVVLDAMQIDSILPNIDYVFTGEGCIDKQSINGKAPIIMAKHAKKFGCKVIGLCGTIGDGAHLCNENGIDSIFSIISKPMDLEKAMDIQNTKISLENLAYQITILIKGREDYD